MKADSFDILYSYELHLAFRGHVQVRRRSALLINLINNGSEKMASKIETEISTMLTPPLYIQAAALRRDVMANLLT